MAIFLVLCTVPLLTTLLYGGVDTIVLGLQSVIAALLIVLWVGDAWSSLEARFSTSSLQLPLIGLILIGLLQLLPFGDHEIASGALSIDAANSISLDPFATRMFVVRLVVYLVFFAAALTFIDTSKRARTVAVLIVIFGTLIGFFGILQWLANPEAIYGLRPTPQAKPFGPFVNQHHFAAFMVMTFGLTLGMLLGTGVKRDRKAFLILAVVILGIGLICTGSRGGVMSLAGAIVFVAAATYLGRDRSKAEKKPKRTAAGKISAVAATAGLGLIVIGSVFYLGGGDSLLRGFGVSQSYVDVSSGRAHFWQIAFQIFAAHPILGSGLDTFGVAFTQFDTQNGKYRVENAHNEYIQALSDAGIGGFAFVVGFLVILFRKGLKNIAAAVDELSRSIAVGALAGCFGIAIHSFFDFPLRTPSNALFFLLLAVLATKSSGYRSAE